MRMLIWHCTKFEYRPVKKALKEAEIVEKKWQGYTEVLVFFITVESTDSEEMCDYVSEEIVKLKEEVKAERVLLYPYAHLSPDLASPEKAMRILRGTFDRIKKFGVEVYMAPFGYYKEFRAEVKGHPLAERSRMISPDEAIKAKKEKGKKSYLVVYPDGKIVDSSEIDLNTLQKDFRVLVEKEALGLSLPEVKHEMMEYLKRFGFEWESRSDFGHQRLGPLAAQIFDLVAEYARMVVRKLGVPVYEVKGTAFFNMKDKAVKEHADLYGDRLYKIKTDKGTFVLRYAACHQQFSLLSDWYLSYKNLPLGMLEIADSYRYEQSGEVELSFRLRRFWMPDMHVLVEDEDKAKEILLKIHDLIIEEANKLDENYELLINVVSSEQFERYKDFIIRIAKKIGKPVLVAVYPSTGLAYYWTINIEYNIVDYAGRPREIGTVQIDIGNAKRFGITFVDKTGEKRHPVILHTAIIGTIERYIYMLFDYAMKRKKKGKKPMLPLWVSPIQVRIIPVDMDALGYAENIYEELSRNNIRVDIDDTNRTVKRKILDAEKNWIPYIIVVGKKEVERKTLMVRIRKTGEQKEMNVNGLIEILNKEQAGYPWRTPYYPKKVSIRPV